jgi:hypothetical protein
MEFDRKYLVDYKVSSDSDIYKKVPVLMLKRGPDWTQVVNDPANMKIIGVLVRLSALCIENKLSHWTYGWDVDSASCLDPGLSEGRGDIKTR